MAGVRGTTLGAAGGGDLAAAAQEIADRAKELAGEWSQKIPPTITTRVDGDTATIEASASNAYPAEFRARHPLFGDRKHWYGPPGEPFLGPALEQRMGAAMARYARKIDRWCRARGFK